MTDTETSSWTYIICPQSEVSVFIENVFKTL